MKLISEVDEIEHIEATIKVYDEYELKGVRRIKRIRFGERTSYRTDFLVIDV